MQERFGPCGMLVAVGELQPFPFHLAPELARSGFARPHGDPAAFGGSFQAFSDFGRHSPIKPVGSDGSVGKKSGGNCPSFFRARPLPPHARHLVSRFRSSQAFAAASERTSESKGHKQLYDSSAAFEPEVRNRARRESVRTSGSRH